MQTTHLEHWSLVSFMNANCNHKLTVLVRFKSEQAEPLSCKVLSLGCDGNRREAIAPLQTKEAVEIRRKSDLFAENVEEFRKFFLAKAPFRIKENDLTLEHVSPEDLETIICD